MTMNLSPDRKRAVLDRVDMTDAEQVFNAVAAALAGATRQPAAWARPDELDRLADAGVGGRSCYLSKEKKDRCTVPLYPAAPDGSGPARELLLAAVRTALAEARKAASLLEDVQFRSGMETACDEIEACLPAASVPGAE